MKNTHGSVRSYLIGFGISLVLTIGSYLLVVGGWQMPLEILIALVLCFAVMQLFVQLIFFLHLGFEKGPKWNLAFFISTVGIILLIVLGSLWIMYHLNYNMMPKQMNEYLIWKEGIH
ncbi:MAG: cytochrome o ubiquinol oxidase subunit IV [Niabella sp.]|nr:MAG: cytochrome o ubiquinol oxidase subunit IV [Niabella sp.]